MNAEQALAFSLIGGAVALFIWGRYRYDTVALVALLIGVLTGAVKPQDAFSGFSSDVVMIIASALVLSAAISRSGVIEPFVRPLVTRFRTPATQVPVLAAITGLFSMGTKNVGALATLMPVAVRMGRAPGSNPAALLMPMSFMALVGGLVTLVGTSTNIIVSEIRQDMLGKPFRMFDFAPVGLGLTALALVFVSFAWRLLPRDRRPRAALGEVTADAVYVTEAQLPDAWPERYATVADLKLGASGVRLVGLIHADGRAMRPLPDARLKAGMTLLLEGEDQALGTAISALPLKHVRHASRVPTSEANEERRLIEAVVERGSPLVGHCASEVQLERRHGTRLVAIGRRDARITRRLGEEPLQPGDLLMLQAGEGQLAGTLRELGLLPLAERTVTIGDPRTRWGPLVILIGAIALVVTDILPIGIAFFCAAVLVVAIGSLTMREAYGALEPEVLVLVAALMPISDAVQQTGGTELVGHALASLLDGSAPIIVLGGMMLAGMAATPFLHNAPTVLVLGPIGVTLAQTLGLAAEPFLMAVAIGSGCDFLTPVGHQCNTLVRGPGGYRFGDYWRLGLPLSLVVLLCGTPLIAYFWPLS
jgi:di/tricarboxylate transporter